MNDTNYNDMQQYFCNHFQSDFENNRITVNQKPLHFRYYLHSHEERLLSSLRVDGHIVTLQLSSYHFWCEGPFNPKNVHSVICFSMDRLCFLPPKSLYKTQVDVHILNMSNNSYCASITAYHYLTPHICTLCVSTKVCFFSTSHVGIDSHQPNLPPQHKPADLTAINPNI